jgi:multidrug transporter EmrE-like cation transporter
MRRTSMTMTSDIQNPQAKRAYIALAASLIFGIAGQLLMKSAALGSVGHDPIRIVSFSTLVALGVYGFGVINWIIALHSVNLSVAYSLTSLNYVGIFLGSYFFFGEVITLPKLIGVALIFFGVMLIVIRAKSASASTP